MARKSERRRGGPRLGAEHFRAILQHVADGITVQDLRGRLVYANNTAARLIGYPSAEALLAAPLEEIRSRFQVMDEQGEPLPFERLPGRLALGGEPAPEAVVRFRDLGAGAERWSIVRAVPIHDDGGNVQFEVTATQDVTALKRGEIRLRILADATALLVGSLDHDTTLSQLARLLVPELADWAAVDLVDEEGGIRRVAVSHIDPAKVAWAQELHGRYPPDPNALFGVPAVIRTGKAELYPRISNTMLEALAVDPEHLRLLKQVGLSSALVVPLRAGARVVGAISLAEAESDRHYSATDLALAEELATSTGLSLENARLYRQAQEALHAREQLLSSVSHDLRTPLTTIRGMTQSVLRRAARTVTPDSEVIAERLDLVDRAAMQMQAMLEELLDFARLEAGRPLDLNREELDLVRFVQQLAQDYQQQAPHHRICLETELERLVGVWDSVRLGRVLTNLLSNAVKYSPKATDVTISLTRRQDDQGVEDWAELSVKDRGLGIPAADLPRIFERFHRGRNVAGRIRGVGIGLAGAKQIIEQHHGSLEVRSQEGRGTMVTLCLPITNGEDTEQLCE